MSFYMYMHNDMQLPGWTGRHAAGRLPHHRKEIAMRSDEHFTHDGRPESEDGRPAHDQQHAPERPPVEPEAPQYEHAKQHEQHEHEHQQEPDAAHPCHHGHHGHPHGRRRGNGHDRGGRGFGRSHGEEHGHGFARGHGFGPRRGHGSGPDGHGHPTLARSIMKSARRIRRSGLSPEQLQHRIAATVSHADYVTTMRTLRRIGMDLRAQR